MAWICLVESEALQKPLANGSNQSPTVNVSLIPKEFCYPGWLMEQSQKLQSGQTCELLTDQCFQPLTSSMGDSPVRISVLQELEKAWKVCEAAFFTKLCGWPKKSSPNSYSLKMSQPSELEAWIAFSKNLPRQGMTVDGQCYPLRMWEPIIKEKDGFYLPSPTASDGTMGAIIGKEDRFRYTKNGTIRHYYKTGKNRSLTLGRWVKFWPTPAASQIHKKIRPQAPSEAKNEHGTMTVGEMGRRHPETIGGYLNPKWVEWLMGYPTEWTVLSPLVMPWFLSKRKRRSKSSCSEKDNE
jgi:hypothetical protein